MTAKRYYIGNGENCTICDSSKGGSDFFNMLTQYQAVDELNALYEENEQLKQTNQELYDKLQLTMSEKSLKGGEVSILKRENEQLKKAITTTDELLMNQWKENQRIKHTIKEAHYNERTAIGKSVLKQLIEQME